MCVHRGPGAAAIVSSSEQPHQRPRELQSLAHCPEQGRGGGQIRTPATQTPGRALATRQASRHTDVSHRNYGSAGPAFRAQRMPIAPAPRRGPSGVSVNPEVRAGVCITTVSEAWPGLGWGDRQEMLGSEGSRWSQNKTHSQVGRGPCSAALCSVTPGGEGTWWVRAITQLITRAFGPADV